MRNSPGAAVVPWPICVFFLLLEMQWWLCPSPGPSIGWRLCAPATQSEDRRRPPPAGAWHEFSASAATDCSYWGMGREESGERWRARRALARMQVAEELLGGGPPGEQPGARQRILAPELQRLEAGGAQVLVHHTGLR